MGTWRQSWQWGREYFRDVRPDVVQGLAPLYARAKNIPHPQLREQALSSLTTKQFHCEGGGVFSSPSRDPGRRLLAFLLPYQTLCDYLDTVTDRGPSQDSANLRQLHQALIDAVHPAHVPGEYYAYHPYQDDGGYLISLVEDARASLAQFPGYHAVHTAINDLVELYVDLQVYKHGPPLQRVPQLSAWFAQKAPSGSDLSWWEFAAASGSTLGIFALLNLALDPDPTPDQVRAVTNLYFPWVGALHILLDYYVDQEEDQQGGDLNFVTYYPSSRDAVQGMRRIYHRLLDAAQKLPDAAFHQYIARGLLGFYLSDRKVRHHRSALTWRLLTTGGTVSIGIYLAALRGRSP
jgi:tetraprenyl-beta-curcumene synthase